MKYFIFLIILLCSCNPLKQVGLDVVETIGEVVIDNEIYTPLINNRNTLEDIDGFMNPDDNNQPILEELIKVHNKLILDIATEIQLDGVVLYETYKQRILLLEVQIGNLQNKYPKLSSPRITNIVEDFVISTMKDFLKKYARKIIAKEFIKKFSYPTR